MDKSASSRRMFLKNSALTAFAAAIWPGIPDFFRPVGARHVGLQLYSLRADMAKNPTATIEAVAKMGYKEIEAYGFDAGKLFGMAYSEFGKLMQANGLTMPSTHFGFSLQQYDAAKNDIKDEVKRALDAAPGLGAQYVIAPWIGEQERKDIGQTVKALQAYAQYCKKAGVRFAYHNHDFEFTQRGPDGRLLMEWLLHEVDPALMCMEMDIYWVSYAGYNPLDWFKRYPGRWELCHAKDMAKTEKRETVEVGDGSIDFPAIFKNSKQAGLQYYVVELEDYVTTPLEGVEKARKNLVKML